MVELLEKMGGIAGIGGLVLGVFLLLFREIIRKQILPKLTQQQAYRIIGLLSILVWSVAIIGIVAWFLNNHGGGNGYLNRRTTAEDKRDKRMVFSGVTAFNVEIMILPATANQGAHLQPNSVALELHSSRDTQSIDTQTIMTMNFPTSKLFVWSPEISGDVILRISIGSLVLTKRYPGRLGFPEFLRQFHKGNRVFRTNEFNPEESKVLKDFGIEFLSISFIIHGAEPVMHYLSQ